ncbi:MAG: DUF2520 domain-containing protein [Acidobacteriota bacterium]|nr:DUF2520 domain-containing protein [Acidobacteriota bacterium]
MQRTDPGNAVTRLAIIGAGRLGTAIAAALRGQAGFELTGPLGRDERLAPATAEGAPSADVVLLCVPDREIAAAAAALPPGPIVGHCSGATGLEPLAPHEAFSLHPLMTVARDGADFSGATAAIDAGTEQALAVARLIAHALGMETVRVQPEDRVAYHAAASIASNFLVTLEAAAERLAASAGVSRQALAPLVRASVENWVALGPEQALTGPLARGDAKTVARQRAAVAERTPDLMPLFDALTTATRDLAAVPLP